MIKRDKITIYEYFSNYSEKEINNAITILPNNYRDILYKYYGNNFLKPIYNIDLTDEERKILNKCFSRLNQIICHKESIINSKRNIYVYFSKYSEKEINEAISFLKEKERKQLIDYYGGNLSNPNIKNDLTEKEKRYIINFIYPKLKKILELNYKKEDKFIYNFQSIVDCLYNNNFELSLLLIEDYTKDKELYFELVSLYIQISILENDENFIKPLNLLADMSSIDLSVVLVNAIQSFYIHLSNNNNDLLNLYMKVILLLDKMNVKCIFKNNLINLCKVTNKKIEALKSFNEALMNYKNLDIRVELNSPKLFDKRFKKSN